jgi:hypothetical protein
MRRKSAASAACCGWSNWGDEGLTARDHNGGSVIQYVDEVKETWHEPTENYHEDPESAVYSFEQFVERQRGKRQRR